MKSLPSLLQATGDSEGIAEVATIAMWTRVAGEGLRAHAVPLRLNQKTLIVAVADEVWKKQLESMAGQLVFRLNSLLGQAVVTFIEFRIDQKAVASARDQLIAARPENARAERASEVMPAELLAAAATIHDPQLRRSFLGAATSCIRRLDEKAVSSSEFRVSSFEFRVRRSGQDAPGPREELRGF